jgi:hypothetical protein
VKPISALSETAPVASRGDRSVEKGVLFCDSCRHRSHYREEWTVVETADSIRYRCPHCHTDVMTRRRPPVSFSAGDGDTEIDAGEP